jgi:ArsR family transcriptional regulator
MNSIKTAGRERTAQLFHALSDETRLHILELLAESEQCVCDLTDTLKTGQSRLSFHLKTLKDAGLLQDRRDGRWVYYALNQEAIGELDDLLKSLKLKAHTASKPKPTCE